MAKGSGRTNKLRYGGGIEDLFDENTNLDGDEVLEPVFEIDTDIIDQEANTLASGIVANVARVYASDDFLKEHPEFRKRLDSEIQSLKMHYKMRAVDEKIQDELVRAIGRKADNASLYVALPKLQAQMVNTQNKIDSTLDRIQNMLKGYQTELSLVADEEEYDADDDSEEASSRDLSSVTTRGTKDFIKKFHNMNLDDGNDEPDSGSVQNSAT